MRFVLLLVYLTGSRLFFACGHVESGQRKPDPVSGGTAIPTVIRTTGTTCQLLRNGKPYFIQGACSLADGPNRFERLRTCGGNSVRIWDDNEADQVLADAQRLGLTVMMGVAVEREYEGFDYNDQEAIDKQTARIRKQILKYRNHPALLMWCLGNESALKATNLNVYDELNRLIRMIHELDPNHPVTTAVSLDSERVIWLVRERCPDLDILSLNSYGETLMLRQYLDKGGWTGPYILSEFGSLGYWEVNLTPWETALEPTSQQKYEFISSTYQKYIGNRPPNCLGAYLFLWGSKQEETHTWFSFFDEQGRETPLVGLMQQLWTKQPPANQSPAIRRFVVDQRDATQLSFAPSARRHQVQIVATDPDGDPLTYRWEIRQAASQRSAYENIPLPVIDGLIQSPAASTTAFTVPRLSGAYRLFVYVYDTHQHVATANLAFQVTNNGGNVVRGKW